MRRFSANYIFTAEKEPLKNGIVEVDSSGKIINVIDTKGKLSESRNLEFYNGIIVPGFINTHCHLELSELENNIPTGIRLPNFIEEIFHYKRSEKKEDTMKAIQLQDSIMQKNGIVAVGDICNTSNTIKTKTNSKIYYHNFIEAIGLEDDIDFVLKGIYEIQRKFVRNDLITSIVPHAPYSVSTNLLKKITEIANSKDSVLSIHNQETESENEMFLESKGLLYDKLKNLNVDLTNWEKTGENSVQSILNDLTISSNIIFVHNTYSSERDLAFINAKISNAFWCLCPKSNLFIENRIPEIPLFLKYSNKLTIGTDSLASNNELSILEELKLIQNKYPEITIDELIQWATLNGARSLKIDKQCGSIEKGKTPGLNLISHFNFQEMKLTDRSRVKVLI